MFNTNYDTNNSLLLLLLLLLLLVLLLLLLLGDPGLSSRAMPMAESGGEDAGDPGDTILYDIIVYTMIIYTII